MYSYHFVNYPTCINIFTDIPRTTDLTSTPETSVSSAMKVSTTATLSFEEEFEQNKRELEDMGTEARRKKRERSKTSVWDMRTSATSVGVVATAILISMMGAIVVLDAATICLHCRQFSSKSKTKCIRSKNIADIQLSCQQSSKLDSKLSQNKYLTEQYPCRDKYKARSAEDPTMNMSETAMNIGYNKNFNAHVQHLGDIESSKL